MRTGSEVPRELVLVRPNVVLAIYRPGGEASKAVVNGHQVFAPHRLVEVARPLKREVENGHAVLVAEEAGEKDWPSWVVPLHGGNRHVQQLNGHVRAGQHGAGGHQGAQRVRHGVRHAGRKGTGDR